MLAETASQRVHSRAMRCRSICLISVLLLLSLGSLAEDPKPAAKPLDSIAWLVGDWHATAAPPNGEKTEIDNHVAWDATGSALTFVTKFNGKPHYSGMYAFDPGAQKIGFWYVDVDGNFTSGTSELNGERLVQNFTTTHKDGSKGTLMSYIDPASDKKSYHWQVLRPGDPKILIELDYVRK